jgi:hypothetical protein
MKFQSKRFKSISHIRSHAKDASDTYPLPPTKKRQIDK